MQGTSRVASIYTGFKQAISRTRAACSFSNKAEVTMIPRKHTFTPSYRFLLCCFLGIFGAISFIAPAIAQDTQEKANIKNSIKKRVGFNFSLAGAIADTFPGPLRIYGAGNIESSEDDVIPYPSIFFSMRYDKYQLIIGWDDNFDPDRQDLNNESIVKIAIHYNYYPFTKNLYLWGGPVLWRFNKKFHFSKYVCDEFDYEEGVVYDPPCKPGASRHVEIVTDRPNGKSLTFGITSGLGVEYTLLNVIVLSHEIEFFYSPCKYKEFICIGGDIKFLGVHFEL